MVTKLLCLVIALVIDKSASQTLTVTSPCISTGKSVTLRCQTPDISKVISFILGTSTKGGCSSSGTCFAGSTDYSKPTQHGTYTEMTIIAYDDARDGGVWKCTHDVSTSNLFTVELGVCIIICIGTTIGYTVHFTCGLVPKASIIGYNAIKLVWHWYFRTQKVTIKMTTAKKYQEATYDIKNDVQNQDMIPKEVNGTYIYSCVVFGGQLITCRFNYIEEQLKLSFMISDDLLWVSNGQTVTLPTTLSINGQSLHGDDMIWTCNDKPVQSDAIIYSDDSIRLRILEVDESHFGTYKCIKPVPELESGLLEISNMRLSGCPCRRPCLYLVLCAVVVLSFDLASVLIVVLQRSKEGYCVNDVSIVLAVLIPIVIFTSVIVFLISKLSMKKTGKEQSDQCCSLCKCGCAVTPSENHTERGLLPLVPYPVDGNFEETKGRKPQLKPLYPDSKGAD